MYVDQRAHASCRLSGIFNYVSLWEYVHMSMGAHRCQIAPELELEAAGSHQPWVLETEFGPSARALFALNF